MSAMQSTAFNAVVSPRGVKPRSTQSIPARVPQPRGGLTSLKSKAFSPKLASKVVGVVPAAEDLIGGLQMASGGQVGGLGQMTEEEANQPSYAQYMQGAAPKGLDPDQYQGDYQRYLQEMQRARQPARMASRIPPELAQERERNTSNLPLAVGAGAYGAANALSMLPMPGDAYEAIKGEAPKWMPTSDRQREWPSMLGVDTKSPLYNESFDAGNLMAGVAITPQMLIQLYKLARKIPAGLRTLRDVLKDETAGATSMPEPQGHGGWR